MTADEFRDRLQRMAPKEKELFKKRTGSGDLDDERCVDNFLRDPGWNAIYHDVLGRPSEGDKAIRATIAGRRLAWIALVTSLVSLVVSVITLLK
jgi:hypothetical protein